MIRRAITADVPALVGLAQQEHALSRMSATPFEPETVASNFAGCITGLSSAVFVSERNSQLTGLIAGMVQRNLHNRFCTVYELLWFSTDGRGMRLLEALKAWADRMRATDLVVHNYAGIKSPASFNKVMQRRGFEPLGQSYTIRLEN